MICKNNKILNVDGLTAVILPLLNLSNKKEREKERRREKNKERGEKRKKVKDSINPLRMA